MRFIIYILVVITLFACKSSKNTSDKNSAKSDLVGGIDTSYRFSVSFISIGAGIDGQVKQQYDQFLSTYEQENKVKLSYEITPWGREGEVDYCFKLIELNKDKKNQFVEKSKETLKNSTLIRFSENIPCKEKRK